MSQKQKPKEKKSEFTLELERQLEVLRSSLLQRDLKLRRCEQQNSRLGIDLHEAQHQNDKLKKYVQEEFEKLNLSNKNYKERIAELTDKKNQLEIQVATLSAKIQFERKQTDESKKEKERQFEDCRRHFTTEIGKFQVQSNEYTVAINQRQAILNEKANLIKILEEEREKFKNDLADRDRDKIQALDTLKKEMMDKFRDMKNNLLSIRRDQLNNNTRLTILQNHQLIQQLEYQSLNTQKVVDRNVEMEKKIKELSNEIEIREEVEREVVKRSVISKKMLETYHNKANILEKENDILEKQRDGAKCAKEQQNNLNVKVKQLNRALDGALSKIEELQKKVLLKQTQIAEFKNKQTLLKTQKQQLSQLIFRYLKECLSGKIECDGDRYMDLQKLKKKDVKDWEKWQIQIITEVILNQIKGNLAPTHMSIQNWRKIADKRTDKICPANKENLIVEQMKKKVKCDSQYIRTLSLQKNKLFYQIKKKNDGKSRSLTRVGSNLSVSFSKYVQGNVRNWGSQMTSEQPSKNLVERFMKPIKLKLKKGN